MSRHGKKSLVEEAFQRAKESSDAEEVLTRLASSPSLASTLASFKLPTQAEEQLNLLQRVLSSVLPQLRPVEGLVYLYCFWKSLQVGEPLFHVTYREIAGMTKASRRTLQRAINRLLHDRWLIRVLEPIPVKEGWLVRVVLPDEHQERKLRDGKPLDAFPERGIFIEGVNYGAKMG